MPASDTHESDMIMHSNQTLFLYYYKRERKREEGEEETKYTDKANRPV